jgi:putative transposase
VEGRAAARESNAKFTGAAAVELATLTWVSWFNNHRLMGPLGYIPPTEAEANYYRQLAVQSAVAA